MEGKDAKDSSDFTEDSLAHGLKFGEFNDIPNEKISKLIRLMARISEKSYRRGVQQAAMFFIEKDGAGIIDSDQSSLHDWRYGTSLDESPGLDGYHSSSLERLFCECHVFDKIGLFEKEDRSD